jgi:hypothetical protein
LDKREGFLHWVFGNDAGYLCVGYRVASTGAFVESFHRWPDEASLASEFINQRAMMGDMYFCTTLLRDTKRVKENATVASQIVWADLDTCDPEVLRVEPTVVVETSPGRYHAYWKLDKAYPALQVEEVNKRIAYAHVADGCDKTGWPLTKYLRVPNTYNHKYLPSFYPVEVGQFHSSQYPLDAFDVYPAVEVNERLDVAMPSDEELAEIDPNQVLIEVRGSVNPRVWRLATEEPEFDEKSGRIDWSKNAWMLALSLFDAGRSREEVFVVLWDAACNKYRVRDDRPNARELVWNEVLRAEEQADNARLFTPIDDEVEDAFYVPKLELLTESEREVCKKRVTIVEEYIEWARTVGDAAVQYHEAGAFVILSTLLAGSVQLYTSYGRVVPNLWFMILADTTLTRKTTAMDLAVDMLVDIDPDTILATDGSIEGLMTSLSMRPGRPSVFLRDEFSGLLEQVSKRDYYAGMLETLTKLYDGKLQKRVLRKETIEVRDPRLILFTGGIKERIYSLLGPEHINSGFVPRFCFITAETDVMKVKPLGPPNPESLAGREYLVQRFRDIYNHYNFRPPVNSDDTAEEEVDFRSTVFTAELTEAAWRRYNHYEQVMVDTGVKSSVNYLLTPVMARLAQSGLKAAILLAATRALQEGVVTVELTDIQQAFFYVERWKQHVLNVVANSGKTATEKELIRVYTFIQEFPGTLRGKIMQHHYLTARSADAVFATLLQRGLVRVEKGKGKQEKYFPIRANRKAANNV